MKKLSLTAAALFFAAPVFAADLAPRYVEPAPPAALFSWEGFYTGFSAGARIADAEWSTTATFNPGGTPIPFSSDPHTSDSDMSGRIAFYTGYNWQVAPSWIMGLEGDVGYASTQSTFDRIPGLNPAGDSFARIETKGFDGSLRLRGGILLSPTVLAYLSGGVAFQNIESSGVCPADTTVCNPALGNRSDSESKTQPGWTIGGGVEAAVFGNWLARAEYRYADFGSYNFTALQFNPAASFGAEADVDVKTHTISLGLAYKF